MHLLHASFYLLIGLIALALILDFINGFHDAANAIATIVSTGVLKPQYAVAMATAFNFLAIVLSNFYIAHTVAEGIVDAYSISQYSIFCGLLAAFFWNMLSRYYGIPSAYVHAVIGGLLGATLAEAGSTALMAGGLVKVILFILLAPLFAFLLGGLIMLIVAWLFFRAAPRRVDKKFRHLQLLSSALYSLGYGYNNAQISMGVILLIMMVNGQQISDTIPFWIVVSSFTAISLGTLFGGWRIVKTMGQKITKLKPVGGFCAEGGGVLTLFLAAMLGIPVSTTHTMTGAIIGVGTTQKANAVRWRVAGGIVWAWVFTIPSAALIAACLYWARKLLT